MHKRSRLIVLVVFLDFSAYFFRIITLECFSCSTTFLLSYHRRTRMQFLSHFQIRFLNYHLVYNLYWTSRRYNNVKVGGPKNQGKPPHPAILSVTLSRKYSNPIRLPYKLGICTLTQTLILFLYYVPVNKYFIDTFA